MDKKRGSNNDRQNRSSGPGKYKAENKTGRPFGKKSEAGSKPGYPSKKRDFDPSNSKPGFRKSDSDKPYKKPYTSRDTAGANEGDNTESSPWTRKKDFKKRDAPAGGDNKRSFSPPSDRPFNKYKKTEGGSDSRDGDRKKSFGTGSDRPFNKYKKTEGGSDSRDSDRKKSFGTGSDRPFNKYKKAESGSDSRDDDRKKSFGPGSDRPFNKYKKAEGGNDPGDGDRKKSFSAGSERPYKKDTTGFRKRNTEGPAENREGDHEKSDRPVKRSSYGDRDNTTRRKPTAAGAKFWDKGEKKETEPRKRIPVKLADEPKPRKTDDDDYEDYEDDHPKSKKGKRSIDTIPETMPLNKYIAYCGVCSRREAAELVRQGIVTVNGTTILDPGFKVTSPVEVVLKDKPLVIQKGMVYILLNKPKDYITTTDDPQGRKTVMDLLVGADGERLFPIGRLDRNTTGVLLITNDGALTQKLAHPSFDVKKVYQVTLDKPLTKADFDTIMEGVELDDGKAIVDTMAYLESKNELGLEIHTGRNRIVRRIFESLGYDVTKLDRVMYAGLTKKNVPRGKWRYLNEREVVLLKHFKL